jgi:ribonuclease T1
MRRLLLACWLGCAALLLPAQAGAGAAVDSDGLPPEARATLQLIERGGPFPHRRDGIVFGNRERLLPPKQHGYYHEYTVPTPGRRDRGARRIVAGEAREYYYSDDHYRSFRKIRE